MSETVKLGHIEPNNKKYQEEHKKKEKLKPVVKRENVANTKKTLSSKLRKFTPIVKQYLLDVGRDIALDSFRSVINGIGMSLFGTEIGRGGSSGRYYYGGNYYDRGSSHRSYSSYYRDSRYGRNRQDRKEEYVRDDKVDYRNIILKYRADAERIIDILHGRIREYGSASVAEFFDLLDLAGEYTDNNWGWRNPDQIGLRRVKDGYLIDVDEAEYLNS